jgi:hypothetical protein
LNNFINNISLQFIYRRALFRRQAIYDSVPIPMRSMRNP